MDVGANKLPKIQVLPNDRLCPKGKIFDVPKGKNLARALLDSGIMINHSCGMFCSCGGCIIHVIEGFNSLSEMDFDEESQLSTVAGRKDNSRLACQVFIGDDDVTILIP